jgi:hypothetical protein
VATNSGRAGPDAFMDHVAVHRAGGRATKTQWKDLSLRRTAAIELLRDPTALWAALSRIAMRPRWRSRRLRPSMVAALATLIVLCLVFLIATFPGERLDSLPSLRFIPWKHGRDNPWGLDYWEFRSPHKLLVDGDVDFGFRRADSLWSNRLMLPDVDVVDHTKYDSEDKLAGIETTVSLRVRHLEGAILIGAKLRKQTLRERNFRELSWLVQICARRNLIAPQVGKSALSFTVLRSWAPNCSEHRL